MANSVNSQPHHRKTKAKSATKAPDSSSTFASARGERRGKTSTVKCVPSRTASMAPSITA